MGPPGGHVVPLESEGVPDGVRDEKSAIPEGEPRRQSESDKGQTQQHDGDPTLHQANDLMGRSSRSANIVQSSLPTVLAPCAAVQMAGQELGERLF
jgi:hypothetical protein